MKNLAPGRLLAFTAAVILCGCGTLDRRPESAVSGDAPKAASADTSTKAPLDFPPADREGSADASMAPLHKNQPADTPYRVNLHIFGLAYHPDRTGTRFHHLDNGYNFGLGLGYNVRNDARGLTDLEVGFFRDSGYNWAKYAGVGYQFKLGNRWRLGADLLAIQSPTYNGGRGFIAPLPRLTYDFGGVLLNGTYIPKVAKYNEFAAFAIYLTIPLRM